MYWIWLYGQSGRLSTLIISILKYPYYTPICHNLPLEILLSLLSRSILPVESHGNRYRIPGFSIFRFGIHEGD